jgi:hypothetical protein
MQAEPAQRASRFATVAVPVPGAPIGEPRQWVATFCLEVSVREYTMPAAVLDYRESPPQDLPAVALRGFSHEDRRLILPALDRAIDSCGCWVVERRTVSPAQVELVLEVQLSGVFELYGALIAAGVELTRASHAALTELCTLRRHNVFADPPVLLYGRVVTLGLEVSFFEESENEMGLWAAGLA